jgi:hypothetical protein
MWWALSQRDIEAQATAFAILAPSFKLFDKLRTESTSDPAMAALRQEVRDGLCDNNSAIIDDLVKRGDHIFIFASLPSLLEVLADAHGVGYEGVQKTLHQRHKIFFVPGTCTIIQDFVHACAMSQRNKTKHLHLAGLLQPHEAPSAVWVYVIINFIEGFPKVSGKSVILIVVDRFSKYAHFIPLSHPYTNFCRELF